MLASLTMAIAIPHAFGDRALMFALGYGSLQVVRNAFVVWATDRDSQLHAAFIRISAVVDRGRGAVDRGSAAGRRPARATIWTLALVIDYAGPGRRLLGAGHRPRRRPGSGRSRARTSPSASSCSSSSRWASRSWSPARPPAALHIDAARGGRDRRLVPDLGGPVVALLRLRGHRSLSGGWPPATSGGALARDAYTYIHVLMVAGHHRRRGRRRGRDRASGRDAQPASELAALAGGPALYLAGHVAVPPPDGRLVEPASGCRRLAALVAAGVARAALMPALACACLILAILIVLIVAETLAPARRRRSADNRARWRRWRPGCPTTA